MKRAVLTCAVLALGAAPIYANWGGQSGGNVGTGAFRAVGAEQVEMKNEDLNIELYRDRAKVQVDYVLHNTGPAVDVKAGFPCLGVASKKKNYLEIEDYQLTADGKPVAYSTEKGDVKGFLGVFDEEFLKMPDVEGGSPRIWWLSSTVHFDANQTKKLRVRYESLYEFSGGGPSDDDYHNNDYFRYLLSTAGAWKGPIRHGKVTIKAVTLDPKRLTLKPADRFKSNGSSWVWNFSDLEPTLADNIEVCLNNKFFQQYQGRTNTWYSFEGDKYYFDSHAYRAQASSEQKAYPVKAISDGNRETAWATGKRGGAGESLTLTLDPPDHITQVGLIPGYTKSKDLYFANNRVREVEVTVNGSHKITATLPHEYISFSARSSKAYQFVDLGSYQGNAKTIKLTVTKVYPGSRHQDLCISEVLLRKNLPSKPKLRANR